MKAHKQILKVQTLPRQSFAALTLFAFLLTHLPFFATPAFAKSSSAAINGNPGMIGMFMAVANLNYSMRVAAENPQDEWRVQNVRHAMGMIPVAMMGLAGEFSSNKLVNNDLPAVMGMLGGFVDKNAAEGYKKFLQKPDASLIPKLGPDFPQSYLAKAEAEGKTQGYKGAEDAPGLQAQDSPEKNLAQTSSDLKQFKDELLDLGSFVAQKKMESEKSSNATIFGDESVSKNGLATPTQLNEPGAIGKATGETVSQSVRDIASTTLKGEEIPSLLAPRELEDEKADKDAEQKKEAEDKAFFKKVGEKKSEEEKARSSKKRKRLREGISFLPSTLRFLPLVALVKTLHAENCGGGGSKDDQQGGDAGSFLQGIAAIMAAVAPMVAVAIQAKSDEKIAKMTTEAQITMTNISAQNSKYITDAQERIQTNQLNMGAKVAKENNEFATDRLQKQLTELRSQRDQTYAMEKEKRGIENDYNNKRISLAEKQATAQENLNKEKLKADIALAGLSQGVNNVSGGQLSINRVTGSGNQTYSAGSRVASNTPATNPNAGGFSGPQLASALQGQAGAATTPGATGQGAAANRGTGASAMGFTGSDDKTKTNAVAKNGNMTLKGSRAFSGTESAINELKGAMQSVNSSQMALYNKILGNAKIAGNSRAMTLGPRKGNSSLLAKVSLNSGSAQTGLMGTARGFAGSGVGIARPIRRIDVYDGRVEQGDEGGESHRHSTPADVSFSFSQ